MKKRKIYTIILIILLVLLDFITKILILNNFSNGQEISIIKNFLKFTFVKNTGAAFGFLSGSIILLIIITILLLFYLIKEFKKNKNVISYILIISGAFGNLIDRIFRGYVIDFISFNLFGKEMPVFNVADIYVTFGVILLIYSIIKEDIHERNNSK